MEALMLCASAHSGVGSWRPTCSSSELLPGKDADDSMGRQAFQMDDLQGLRWADDRKEMEIDLCCFKHSSFQMDDPVKAIIPNGSIITDSLTIDMDQHHLLQENNSHDPNEVDSNTRSSSSQSLFSSDYMTKVEYGLKLGYSEQLIHRVIGRRGSSISHDEFLKELIKEDDCVDSTELHAELGPSGGSGMESLSISDEVATGHHKELSPLRPVVIDGSNVAMRHGNNKVFSCRGIHLAVEWFKLRGHKDITVFVPQWRTENAKQESQITDQEILRDLEREKLLVFTPSRKVNNKRIICYDDRYILNLAVENDGIVVSNDNYRDLITEKPEYKKVVEERLLMYSFVNDRFMPPEDPLGRFGPNIDSFLRRQSLHNSPSSQCCPYAKKCTYGNKCKFYHPERLQQPMVSVTEQLAKDSQMKIKDFQNRGLCSQRSDPQQRSRADFAIQNSSSLTSLNDPADLSSVAISLLSSSRISTLQKDNCIKERHSLPLSMSSHWSVRHKTLRTVHSDPPALSQVPAKCSGHLEVAKKLSDENLVINMQKQAAAAFAVSPRNRVEKAKPENCHQKVCRKTSLSTSAEVTDNGWMTPPTDWNQGCKGLDGAILQSVTKPYRMEPMNCSEETADLGPGFAAMNLNAKHGVLTRTSSAPVKFTKNEIGKVVHNEFDEYPTTWHNKDPVTFHNLTKDVMKNNTGLPSPLSFASLTDSYIGTSWMCNSYLDRPGSAGIHAPDFFGIGSERSKSSSISSSANSNHQGSTFQFGSNSSFHFNQPTPAPRIHTCSYSSHQKIPFLANLSNMRMALFMKLCALFDTDDVIQVMSEHPGEMDSKTLCGFLLLLDQQHKQCQNS